jgi:hypothetical protein
MERKIEVYDHCMKEETKDEDMVRADMARNLGHMAVCSTCMGP